MRRKQIYARVSLPAGDQLAVWSEFVFQGFGKELNAGPGECVLELAVPFDYDGIDLALGNDVEILVADKETTDGNGEFDESGVRMVYKGYISLIERDLSGVKESATVHMLGYYTLLATDILKNAAQTTLYSNSSTGLTVTAGSQNAADIGAMLRAVIDRYRAETTSPRIFYVGSGASAGDDIPDTTTTATYAFEQMTYREAIDQLKKMAPAGTYWYCDETGRIMFKATPSTATHSFVFGTHFSDVHISYSLENVRNGLLVWNGETAGSKVYKHYEDADSIAKYGRRVETDNDYGVDNVNAADLIGTKFLAENKSAAIKLVCTILDSNGEDGKGYDIESIQPGDTCSFGGFSTVLSDVLRDNMLITKVTYYLDRVVIEVEIVKSGLQDFQDKQGNEISKLQSGGLSIPESYT